MTYMYSLLCIGCAVCVRYMQYAICIATQQRLASVIVRLYEPLSAMLSVRLRRGVDVCRRRGVCVSVCESVTPHASLFGQMCPAGALLGEAEGGGGAEGVANLTSHLRFASSSRQ